MQSLFSSLIRYTNKTWLTQGLPYLHSFWLTDFFYANFVKNLFCPTCVGERLMAEFGMRALHSDGNEHSPEKTSIILSFIHVGYSALPNSNEDDVLYISHDVFEKMTDSYANNTFYCTVQWSYNISQVTQTNWCHNKFVLIHMQTMSDVWSTISEDRYELIIIVVGKKLLAFGLHSCIANAFLNIHFWNVEPCMSFACKVQGISPSYLHEHI